MIRLLEDSASAGAVNMARDESLLTRVGAGLSPATLRLYEWSEATISLGYFQSYGAYESLPAPEGELPVVRRLTGGGAILHDLELTYSLALPVGHRLVADGANQLYEMVHDAVIAVVKSIDGDARQSGASDDSTPRRGPFFCFARRHRYDVLVGDAKLAGSAQRRTRVGVLQHGSIIVGSRFEGQPVAEPDWPAWSVSLLRGELPRALERLVHIEIQKGDWTQAELDLAGELAGKYASREWTQRR